MAINLSAGTTKSRTPGFAKWTLAKQQTTSGKLYLWKYGGSGGVLNAVLQLKELIYLRGRWRNTILINRTRKVTIHLLLELGPSLYWVLGNREECRKDLEKWNKGLKFLPCTETLRNSTDSCVKENIKGWLAWQYKCCNSWEFLQIIRSLSVWALELDKFCIVTD